MRVPCVGIETALLLEAIHGYSRQTSARDAGVLVPSLQSEGEDVTKRHGSPSVPGALYLVGMRGTELAEPEAFSYTGGLRCGALGETPRKLEQITADVFSACAARFPQALHRRERVGSHGQVVQGSKILIEGHGFRCGISVLWYRRGHSYRQAEPGGLEVRIGGSAHLPPVATRAALPKLDDHAPLRLLGLGLAAVTSLIGWRTAQLIFLHPSRAPGFDALVLGLTFAALAGAVCLCFCSLVGAWLRPRARTREVTDPSTQITSWRALAADLERMIAVASRPQVGAEDSHAQVPGVL